MDEKSRLTILYNTLSTRKDYGSSDLEEAVVSVGDLLRNDSLRSIKETREFIPALMYISAQIFEEFLDSCFQQNASLCLEISRVIINILADNDLNRKAFLSLNYGCRNYWQTIFKILDNDLDNENLEKLKVRLEIMLVQFFRNTNEAEMYARSFNSLSVNRYLLKHMQRRQTKLESALMDEYVEGLSRIVEFNTEIIQHVGKDSSKLGLSSDEMTLLLETEMKILEKISPDTLMSLQQNEIDELDELCDNLARTIYELTCDIHVYSISTDINRRIISLISRVPNELENLTSIKRNLFAASGNISSSMECDLSNEVEWLLSITMLQDADMYQVAAAEIALGNYIVSEEKRDILISLIERYFTLRSFVKRFLSAKFNDVILFQSFHLLNNLMTESVASECTEYVSDLMFSAKIITDNSTYYKEVTSVYFKFAKRLILYCAKMPDSSKRLFSTQKYWEILHLSNLLLESQELYLLILQSILVSNGFLTTEKKAIEFESSLLDDLIDSKLFKTEVPAWFILQKLKSLGIFFQSVGRSSEVFTFFFDRILRDSNSRLEFWMRTHRLLQFFDDYFMSNSAEFFDFKAMRNNFKFVCASLLNFASTFREKFDNSTGALDDIENIARRSLKKE